MEQQFTKSGTNSLSEVSSYTVIPKKVETGVPAKNELIQHASEQSAAYNHNKVIQGTHQNTHPNGIRVAKASEPTHQERHLQTSRNPQNANPLVNIQKRSSTDPGCSSRSSITQAHNGQHPQDGLSTPVQKTDAITQQTRNHDHDFAGTVANISSPAAATELVWENSTRYNQPRELPTALKEWSNMDYEYFVEQFNAAQSPNDIKKMLHGARTERIAFISLKAMMAGYNIDHQKLKEWFGDGGGTRSRTPIVKVCGDGEYIRISRALAKRFDIKMNKGHEFMCATKEIDGKYCLVLIPLFERNS